MPRKSKVDQLIEKNKETFKKYPIFDIWSRIHLKDYTSEDKYREAFNKFHKPEPEPVGLDFNQPEVNDE